MANLPLLAGGSDIVRIPYGRLILILLGRLTRSVRGRGVGHADIGTEDIDACLSPFPPVVSKACHGVDTCQAYGALLRTELLRCLGEAFVEEPDPIAVALDLCPLVGRFGESLADLGAQISSVRQLVSELGQRVRVLRYPLPSVGDHQSGDTADPRHDCEDKFQEIEQRGHSDCCVALETRPGGVPERRDDQPSDEQQGRHDRQGDRPADAPEPQLRHRTTGGDGTNRDMGLGPGQARRFGRLHPLLLAHAVNVNAQHRAGPQQLPRRQSIGQCGGSVKDA